MVLKEAKLYNANVVTERLWNAEKDRIFGLQADVLIRTAKEFDDVVEVLADTLLQTCLFCEDDDCEFSDEGKHWHVSSVVDVLKDASVKQDA